MSAYLRAPLLFVSLFVVLLGLPAYGQGTLPEAGERQRYSVYIEMPQAYISGIGILKNDGEKIVGSLFNEFGVSSIDFVYYPHRGKVKLLSVMKMLDKWYIRKLLRKDLRLLFESMSHGATTYSNDRRHITYRFTPMTEESEEETNDNNHDTEE